MMCAAIVHDGDAAGQHPCGVAKNQPVTLAHAVLTPWERHAACPGELSRSARSEGVVALERCGPVRRRSAP